MTCGFPVAEENTGRPAAPLSGHFSGVFTATELVVVVAPPYVLLLLEGVGEAVGVGTGFDDGALEREPVHDGGAEAGAAAKTSIRDSISTLLQLTPTMMGSTLTGGYHSSRH